MPTLLVACSVIREFWAENRVSLRLPVALFPAVVAVKGKLEKLVPRPLPVLVDRVIDVKSMNPPSVKSESPMWIDNGEVGVGGGVAV